MKEVVKKERFWNDLGRNMDRVGNGYRLCVLVDLNGRIRDRVRASITGIFGVPGENTNGRRMVEFRAERGLCVGNKYFEHKSLHKYTRLPRGQDGVELKSMIDLVLVNKYMLHYVQNVRAVRGLGRGLSDHHVALCKVRLVGTWIKRRVVEDGARRIRSEKLSENQYGEEYSRSLEGKRV